jgi:hypothetical protein
MTTENLREKINMLNNMIQAEDLQSFQSQLLVDSTSKTTGDEQVDKAMAANATNAKAQILACTRRLETFRAKRAELDAELNAEQPA